MVALIRSFGVLLALALLGGCAGLTGSGGAASEEALARALRARDYAAADALIRDDPKRLRGEAVLGVAIRVGDPQAVRVYAQRYGPDLALDGGGSTPLMLAAMTAPRESAGPVASALLEVGADATLRDAAGKLASHHARWRGEFALAGLLDQYAARQRAARERLARPTRVTPWFPATTAIRPSEGSAHGAVPSRPGATKLTAVAGRKRTGAPVAVAHGPLSREGLVRVLWAAAEPTAGTDERVAFRFHADGTGQLLRWTAGARRIDSVEPGYLAWELERSRLSFSVLAEDLAAWCVSTAAGGGRVDLDCREFEFDTNSFEGDGPRPVVSLDFARVLQESAGARARMMVAARVYGGLEPIATPVCTPRGVARAGVTASARPSAVRGDWHVFDPVRFAAFSPAFGPACTSRQAQQAAREQCRRAGGRQCFDVGGCPVGAVSAVASAHGWQQAVLFCDASADAARAGALRECARRSGCDCSLLASDVHLGPPDEPRSCSGSAARGGPARDRLATFVPVHSDGRKPSTDR